MPVYVGTNAVSEYRVGRDFVQKIYVGSSLLWERAVVSGDFVPTATRYNLDSATGWEGGATLGGVLSTVAVDTTTKEEGTGSLKVSADLGGLQILQQDGFESAEATIQTNWVIRAGETTTTLTKSTKARSGTGSLRVATSVAAPTFGARVAAANRQQVTKGTSITSTAYLQSDTVARSAQIQPNFFYDSGGGVYTFYAATNGGYKNNPVGSWTEHKITFQVPTPPAGFENATIRMEMVFVCQNGAAGDAFLVDDYTSTIGTSASTADQVIARSPVNAVGSTDWSAGGDVIRARCYLPAGTGTNWTGQIDIERSDGSIVQGGPSALVVGWNTVETAPGATALADVKRLWLVARGIPTQTVTTVPGAPTGVAAVRGNASATVSFTPPINEGGTPIIDYRVTSSPGALTATGTASPITITGLTNGTAYTFTVAARNSVGYSVESSASTAVTPATTPGAPTAVSATAGDASASIAFTAPASNGGSAITGYRVTSSPGGFTATGAASPITMTGLTNGTAYTFTVQAQNALGYGTASAASAAVTPAAPTVGRTISTFDTGIEGWVTNAGGVLSWEQTIKRTGAGSLKQVITRPASGFSGVIFNAPDFGVSDVTQYGLVLKCWVFLPTGQPGTGHKVRLTCMYDDTAGSANAFRWAAAASVNLVEGQWTLCTGTFTTDVMTKARRFGLTYDVNTSAGGTTTCYVDDYSQAAS